MAKPITATMIGLRRLSAPSQPISPVDVEAASAPANDRVAFRLDVARLKDLIVAMPGTVFAPAAPAGYERASATLPVADTPAPGVTTLFAAADGSAWYYLPHYELRLSSTDRYDISLTAAAEGGFRLSLGLSRVPPPETTPPPGAQELPHEVTAWIEYTTPAGLALQLPLPELILDGEGRVAGAAGAMDLPERDRLVGAIRGDGSAQLMIRRTAMVASQLPPAATPGQPGLFTVDATAIAHALRDVEPGPSLATAAVMSGTGGVRTLGKRRRRRDWAGHLGHIDLGGLVTDVSPAPTPPPPPQLYRDTQLALTQLVAPEPLKLDETLHGYFYSGAGQHAGSDRPLRRISVEVRDGLINRRQVYFQDSEDQALFYFLPDAFRLGRDDREPFAPEMVVRMEKGEGEGAAGINFTVDYIARPFTLPHSLELALPALAEAIPPTLTAGGAVPRLMPLPAVGRLRLRLPAAAGTELRAFDQVSVQLDNGFHHSFTVPLASFRQLFAAALSADATSLFTGEAEVTLAGQAPVSVPVEIRFPLTEGPVFDAREADAGGGAVDVGLRNATESPVAIRRLPVSLIDGTRQVDAITEQLDLSQPLELAPGAEAAFRIVPAAPVGAGGPWRPVFDLAEVDLLSRADLVFTAISGTAVPPEIERQVEVTALPAQWDQHPGGAIAMIIVDFRSGQSIQITRDTPLPVAVTVTMPVGDLLTGAGDDAVFRFKQQVIRQDATQSRDDQWRAHDGGLLFVPVVP